jgi:hypothetical protein
MSTRPEVSPGPIGLTRLPAVVLTAVCGAAAGATCEVAAGEEALALGMTNCCPTLMTFGSLICDEFAWKMSAHLNPVP